MLNAFSGDQGVVLKPSLFILVLKLTAERTTPNPLSFCALDSTARLRVP